MKASVGRNPANARSRFPMAWTSGCSATRSGWLCGWQFPRCCFGRRPLQSNAATRSACNRSPWSLLSPPEPSKANRWKPWPARWVGQSRTFQGASSAFGSAYCLASPTRWRRFWRGTLRNEKPRRVCGPAGRTPKGTRRICESSKERSTSTVVLPRRCVRIGLARGRQDGGQSSWRVLPATHPA